MHQLDNSSQASGSQSPSIRRHRTVPYGRDHRPAQRQSPAPRNPETAAHSETPQAFPHLLRRPAHPLGGPPVSPCCAVPPRRSFHRRLPSAQRPKCRVSKRVRCRVEHANGFHSASRPISLKTILQSVIASAGIRRCAPGYHAAQSQGRIESFFISWYSPGGCKEMSEASIRTLVPDSEKQKKFLFVFQDRPCYLSWRQPYTKGT